MAPTLHLTYRYTKSRGEPHLPCSKRKLVTEKTALEIDRIELSLRFLLTTKRGTNFHAKESSEWLGVAVVAQAICHLTTGRWWPPLKWTRQQVSKYCPTMISHSTIMMPSYHSSPPQQRMQRVHSSLIWQKLNQQTKNRRLSTTI